MSLALKLLDVQYFPVVGCWEALIRLPWSATVEWELALAAGILYPAAPAVRLELGLLSRSCTQGDAKYMFTCVKNNLN